MSEHLRPKRTMTPARIGVMALTHWSQLIRDIRGTKSAAVGALRTPQSGSGARAGRG